MPKKQKHITGGRPLPKPIINALREGFPLLVDGIIKGDDVFLIMPMPLPDDQEALTATHYIASPEFLTAVRVAESGGDNLEILCEGGFEMLLLAPPSGRRIS